MGQAALATPSARSFVTWSATGLALVAGLAVLARRTECAGCHRRLGRHDLAEHRGTVVFPSGTIHLPGSVCVDGEVNLIGGSFVGPGTGPAFTVTGSGASFTGMFLTGSGA